MSAAPSRRPTAAAVAARTVDPAPISRSRLPLPPVPVSGRASQSKTVRPGTPRVPRPAMSADARYDDWSKSSRRELPSEEEMRAALAPSTSAIPDRSVSRRGQVDDYLDEVPAPRGQRPSSPQPVGGRAALRAERQAADAARRRAAKASGVDLLDEEPRRAPRRVAKGLVAMAVVALGVLGVYQFTSPQTDEAAATDTAPTPVAPISPLPPVPEVEVAPVEPPVAASPVRVPQVVLNATAINGLAAKISGLVAGGGWEAAGVGAYEGTDVSATTVFYTEGDETQRQAAVQLVEQFPQIQGPAPRFFDLPADVTAPGLVIVATGDWQP